MPTQASPQFTPAQLIDAGRRAEGEGRFDLAVQFYQHLTEHYAEAPEAIQAHGALGRIGVWPANGSTTPRTTARATLRLRLQSGRDGYRSGRMLIRMLDVFGWLLVLGGPTGILVYSVLRAENVAFSHAELLSIAAGAAGSVMLGLGLLLAAQATRALFDQANATRDLVALERARLGLD